MFSENFGNIKELNNQELNYFLQKSKEYENSLAIEYSSGYLLQATRNEGYVFSYKNNLAIFSFRGNQPIIISFTGKDEKSKSEIISVLALKLFKEFKKPVIVKNISIEIKNILIKKYNFREYFENETWDQYSKFDDNTFPQSIINVKKLLKLENKLYGDLRYYLNRFKRQYKTKIIDYNDENIFDYLLKKWAKNISKRKNLKEKDIIESQLMFREKLDFFYQYILIDEKNNQPIGFICMSESSKKCLCLNAIINDFNYWRSWHYLTFQGAKIADKLNYQYYNLQGSEDLNQYRNKNKFRPEIELKRIHLIYEE